MRFPLAFVVVPALLAGAAAHAESPVPIRLGEAHAQADTSDFGQGWRMALEEINQAAGVLGRPLEVVAVDVQAGAARPAEIALLFDGDPDDARALQTSRQAAAWRLPYLAGRAQTDRLIWQEGNRYTFRLPPSTRMRIAALAPRALALRQKRWTLVYTASQRGQEEAATFAAMMTAFQSKTEIVSRLAVAPGQVDAGLLRAIDESRPQALLLALDGPELAAFARLLREQPQADPLPAVLTHGEDLPDPAPAAGSPPLMAIRTARPTLPRPTGAAPAAPPPCPPCRLYRAPEPGPGPARGAIHRCGKTRRCAAGIAAGYPPGADPVSQDRPSIHDGSVCRSAG